MNQEKARLTIDMEPDLRSRLKIAAARRGESMRDYCIDALKSRLAQEWVVPLTAAEAPLLAEVWDNEADEIYNDL